MHKIIVRDGVRATEWREVMGSHELPIVSPFPRRVNLPGHDAALVYMLNLQQITPEQREKLVAHLARKFWLPEQEVREQIERVGVPILAVDCIVVSDQRGLFS